MRRYSSLVHAAILGLAIATCAFAQTSGTITGTVVDVADAAVAKAEIQATKATFKTTTSEEGVYTLGQLPAGTYQLSSMKPFFDPFVQPGVVVSAGKTQTLNIHLQDVQLNTLGDGREFFATSAFAERTTPQGPTPRFADGKPDLSGVWSAQRILDPGQPELKPAAEKILKEREADFGKDFPQSFCLPLGITLSNMFTSLWRTVHTPEYMVMISEGDTPGYRQIYLDGRGHPKDFGPTWTGHSIGRWEGDTLVVDTVGFNDKTWLDPAGLPHTEKLHVTERYRRPDLGHLEIEFTIDDPDAFVRPWIIKRESDLVPNEDVLESICTENERDRAHLGGK